MKTTRLRCPLFAALCLFAPLLASPGTGFGAPPEGGTVTMATTTSTENSGLLDVLLPALEKETGITVRVLAKGTGAALRDGRDGNVDLILVHAKEQEERFVAQGFGTERIPVMHNDFVIVGPAGDPAGIRGMKDAPAALRRIAEREAPFVSRGDNSGTHIKERTLWHMSGFMEAPDAWYHSIGQGMGKVLVFADEKRAYALTDRGTFLKYRYGRTPAVELDVLVEGDPRLHNPYAVISVNPKKHPHVKFALAERVADWLVSPEPQKFIADYRIHDRQVFYPDGLTGEK